jgi:hypothetical protein
MQSLPADRLNPVASNAPSEKHDLSAANQARIDVEHGSTGWNAYEVWRTRILGAEPDDSKKDRQKP